MKQDEMRDDYIRMAKDAGCFVTIGGNDYSLIGLMAIERFAQAVAAHERESCAKECDVVAALRQHPLEHKFRLSAQMCATNIRRRHGMTPNVERNRPGGGLPPEGPVHGSVGPQRLGKEQA